MTNLALCFTAGVGAVLFWRFVVRPFLGRRRPRDVFVDPSDLF